MEEHIYFYAYNTILRHRFCLTPGSKSGGVSGLFLKIDQVCFRVDYVVGVEI